VDYASSNLNSKNYDKFIKVLEVEEITGKVNSSRILNGRQIDVKSLTPIGSLDIGLDKETMVFSNMFSPNDSYSSDELKNGPDQKQNGKVKAIGSLLSFGVNTINSVAEAKKQIEMEKNVIRRFNIYENNNKDRFVITNKPLLSVGGVDGYKGGK